MSSRKRPQKLILKAISNDISRMVGGQNKFRESSVKSEGITVDQTIKFHLKRAHMFTDVLTESSIKKQSDTD